MSVVLAGCAPKPTTITETVVQTVTVKPDIPLQPRPDAVTLRNVKFYVVTAENYNQFVEEFLKSNSELVYVAISISDYEDLALNISDLKSYIEQQNSVLVYYENAVK